MNPFSSSTIHLVINRKNTEIPVDSIIYAQVTDKLCNIRLRDGQNYHLFLSISTLASLLPKDSFFQISRSCLISLKYFRKIDNTYVTMSDGSRLPYSKRKKNTLLTLFQKFASSYSDEILDFQNPLNCASRFAGFNNSPVPFCVLQALRLFPFSTQVDYIFRYVNQALADLEGLAPEEMLNLSARDVLGNDYIEAFPNFASAALRGGYGNLFVPARNSNQLLHVLTWQPQEGYCAYILAPMKI